MPTDSCDHRRTTTTTTTTVKPHHTPPEPEHLPCPRCESTNTKFCYYNNYNFSQPRHFCKACRRYWTHGGTLRDIPVGGGSRKNAKRSRLSHTTHNTFYTNSPSLEFRHVAPVNTGTPILIPSMCDSFTSLLNSTQGPGSGFFGFQDGRMTWPFSGVGDGGGNVTWQMETGGESGECFTLPDLMI